MRNEHSELAGDSEKAALLIVEEGFPNQTNASEKKAVDFTGNEAIASHGKKLIEPPFYSARSDAYQFPSRNDRLTLFSPGARYAFSLIHVLLEEIADRSLMGIEIRRERPSGVQSASIKFAVLIWLTIQNAVHALLLRYSRVRDVPAMYFSTVAVFWTEVIKLFVCLVMVYHNSNNGILDAFGLMRRQIFDQPRDTFKVCLPSMLYILQNNLFYTAASHLNAATFMIVSQLKIFSAAIFSIILLNRSLARAQWVSLCVLFIGVCFVQFQPEEPRKTESRNRLAIEQNVLTGFTAASIACGLSGFSGVFFEKILKGSAPVSLWMRNIQMSIFAVPASFLAAVVQDGTRIREHGFMHGWDNVVWLTSLWYAVGGLSVAVCIKYADNIAKNFATSVAIILATFGSIYFFGFQPSLLFTFGALFVIMSIFLYSSSSFFLRHFNVYGSSSSCSSLFSSPSHRSSLKTASNSSNFLSPKA